MDSMRAAWRAGSRAGPGRLGDLSQFKGRTKGHTISAALVLTVVTPIAQSLPCFLLKSAVQDRCSYMGEAGLDLTGGESVLENSLGVKLAENI